MIHRLTPAQRDFFTTATKEQRAAFLARGPAEAAILYAPEREAPRFAPFVRGFRIGEDSFASAENALVAAEAARVESGRIATRIDEAALGLDDSARDLDRILNEATASIDALVVLAGLSEETMPELLHDLLEEIDEQTVRSWTWLPSLARYLHLDASPAAGDRYDPDRHNALADPDSRRAVRAIREAFIQAVHDDAGYGFLAFGRQPVGSYRDGSMTYSWGHTRTCVRFGRTADAAIRSVGLWGQEAWAARKAESEAA